MPNNIIKDLKDELVGKWVLIDTNVLLKASTNPKAFLPLLNLFKESEACSPAYCDLIRAELM